jgi:molybdopterin-containing oxidoreductase family iron-sulfur binding subunit
MAEEENKDRYRWGMAIDLDLCTGCQACVVACHAENNVPAAGQDEVIHGRSMHWIRVERYWKGEQPHLQAEFRPMLCQHCQNAPCEPVCPAYATVHDEVNGLNTQIYNRCIGTRYCGANCPYKMRMFNWFAPYFPEPLTEQLNPDVTVRSQGVMEKCSLCIQRIRRVRETARREGREIRDGEIQPACVQTCPTEALVFGDLNDPLSLVSEMARSSRAYHLLEDLGTEPSIAYLQRGESDVNHE